ncbi:hypothetical protein D3C76_1451800 [compost metagenome]
MLRGTAVDAHGLTVQAQFTGVAGGAGNIQKCIRAAGILMPCEAHGQVAGVVRRGFLLGVDQETEAREVLRRGESLL